MKLKIASCLLILTLFTGCAALERLDQVQSKAEKLVESGLEQAAIATVETIPGLITREEARDIALAHAKLTTGQISRLQIEYDPENGMPQYEVEFHQGPWEHHYEIDARTGEILSQEREQ